MSANRLYETCCCGAHIDVGVSYVGRLAEFRAAHAVCRETPQFASGVAEATYRHVIENALSGVARLDTGDQRSAVEYLCGRWLPFAEDVQTTWNRGRSAHIPPTTGNGKASDAGE